MSAVGDAGDPHISLVVLTYNRRAELARSLSHLCALPERPAIIVVVNGSTDDTADYLRTHYPQITVVISEQNLGAAGRNLGVERVRTPLVAFSDDDTWWAPGALAFAAQTFSRHPDIAVLNANILVGPDHRPDPACLEMQNSPLEAVPGVGPLLTGFMAGANVMRTQAFRQAGGYWPPFFIGGEEALLAMDILDSGGRIAYAPAMCVHHWPSCARDSSLRQYLIARNAVWTACLRLPWSLVVQRSRLALRGLPQPRMLDQILADTAREMPHLLSGRRVLAPETLHLLQRVWALETRAY